MHNLKARKKKTGTLFLWEDSLQGWHEFIHVGLLHFMGALACCKATRRMGMNQELEIPRDFLSFSHM